ncbi:DHGL dehydrogenase, partial [Acromyrmex heyeri]
MLISLDVVSLFTNIPVDLASDSVVGRWDSTSKKTKIPLAEFLIAFRIVLNSTVFIFNKKMYKQIFGRTNLIFDVYHKATFSGRFLNFYSHHPLCHKRGVIYGVVDKIFWLCHPKFQQNNLIDVIKIFLQNGFTTDCCVFLPDFFVLSENALNEPNSIEMGVGAGSAGAILATNLAEDKHSVLLLEAGGTAPLFLDIPLLTPIIQNTVYDWQYVTVPQEHACKGLINNQSRWPRGKILGGTSRLNFMAYVLGHRLDYEKWFPDFAESVAKNDESISISDLRWTTDFADVILNAVKELNHNISNINLQLDTGFTKAQLTMENGRRWSTDKILYQKPNHVLTILTHAHATKILVNFNKAEGVEFVRFGNKYIAVAKKGVILSAGAVESPKLLMLSGIGPKKHLEDFGVACGSIYRHIDALEKQRPLVTSSEFELHFRISFLS